MDKEEIIADSEEEQEYDSRPDPNPIRNYGESFFNNSISEITEDVSAYTSITSPKATSLPTISSLDPLRNPADTSLLSSISSPAPSIPQNRNVEPLPSHIPAPNPTTSTSLNDPPKKPRPKPRRRVNVEDTTWAPFAPQHSTPSVQIPSATTPSAPAPTNPILRDPVPLPPPIQQDEPRRSAPLPLPVQKDEPKRAQPPKRPSEPQDIIHILSSEGDVIVIPPKKKPKTSSTGHSEHKEPSLAITSSKSSMPEKKKKKKSLPRMGFLDCNDDEDDDPMRLKDTVDNKASNHAMPRLDDDRYSDFDPDDQPSKPKPKKKRKSKGDDDERPKKRRSEVAVNQPSTKATKLKESFKSDAYILDSDSEQDPVEPSADQTEDYSTSIPTSHSKVLTKATSSDKKGKGLDNASGKKKKKRAIISDEEDDGGVTHFIDDLPLRSQRSSARVAIAKSIASPSRSTSDDTLATGENQPCETVGSPQRQPPKDLPVDKPRVNKKSKKRKDVDDAIEQPNDDAPKQDQQLSKPVKPKVKTVVEVVVPLVRTGSAKENLVPHANDSPATAPAPEPPEQSSHRPLTPVTQGSEKHASPKLSTSPPTSRVPMKPRASLPSHRRPNKPLTVLLGQASTPARGVRQAGLSKFTRIAPLHAKRKTPPPPPPPIPRKKDPFKKTGENDEDSDGDWGETRGNRIKRLVREFEDLEGRDSKQANDRRKEIENEIAAISAGY